MFAEMMHAFISLVVPVHTTTLPSTGVTAKAMRAELNKLVNGIKDPNYKAVSV